MGLYRLLFPTKSRHFKGKRWLKITIRSFHILGVIGFAGGFFYGNEYATLNNFLLLATVTGFLLILLDVTGNGVWIIQNRGLSILFKIILLALFPLLPNYQTAVLVFVILLSGMVSHAPGDFRYYSIFHRKRIETL